MVATLMIQLHADSKEACRGKMARIRKKERTREAKKQVE
jgi:hypothetical protein